MEKIITCMKCRKTFTVSGPYSSANQVLQGVTCPFCGGANDVKWPMDTVLTTIPKKKIA
jgi:DNA-directed RNA polymerase subunit RPC12/RpoP